MLLDGMGILPSLEMVIEKGEGQELGLLVEEVLAKRPLDSKERWVGYQVSTNLEMSSFCWMTIFGFSGSYP